MIGKVNDVSKCTTLNYALIMQQNPSIQWMLEARRFNASANSSNGDRTAEEIKKEVKTTMTVQEWIDHLKWCREILQKERQHNLRITFAFGTVFIGSILTIASSISIANWPTLIIGAAGVFCFGLFLIKVIKGGNTLFRDIVDIMLVLNSVIIGDLDTPEKIEVEYRKSIKPR